MAPMQKEIEKTKGKEIMKPGWKTSEFWVTVAVQFAGILATMGVFTPDQSDAMTEAITQIGGIVAMLASAFGYSISRGVAKRDVAK